jgi:hypothetical protein
VSFIDDHSKYTWIYLLRQKSDVFAVFHDFQALVERKFDKKILSMQIDWGGEYERLNSFFQRIGIAHRVSFPHAHQQNGAAERKHRHIVEVGLALLANASMPLKFWDEAFLTATRLINLLPSKVVNYKTPTELLLKETSDYSPLRVFGCACWPNLRPFNSRKLEFRSKRCAFLGYSSLHKGFKCVDISTGRVCISRDVIFDEEVFPFASLHENAGARLRHEISLLPEHLLSSHPGVVDAIDQYFANANPDHPTSEVNMLQEVQGDDCEENWAQNQLLGAVHGASIGSTEANKLDTEGEEDLPGVPGVAVGGDSASLGSRADPPAPPVGTACDKSAQARDGTGQAAPPRRRITQRVAARDRQRPPHMGQHLQTADPLRPQDLLRPSLKYSAPKTGHKVEFSSPKFTLMTLFSMQTLAPQVNQQIYRKPLMIQIGRRQCERKLRHYTRMKLGILFLLLRVPISLIVDGCSK